MGTPKVEIGRWDESRGSASQDPQSQVAPLDALAWLLDNSIPVPGTRFRIGVEALLGLIPVIGDVLGAFISSYILLLATKMGVPRVTLMRMAFNVGLESLVGVVPFLGDAFDMAWKSNKRNVDLLRAHLQNPTKARKGDWFFAILLVLGLLALVFLLGWAGYSAVAAINSSFRE